MLLSEKPLLAAAANASIYRDQALRARLFRVADELGYTCANLPDKDLHRLVLLRWIIESRGLRFEEGARVLLEFWSRRSNTSKNADRMPVRIYTLVGPVSERILEEYIARTYPYRAQFDERCVEAREALLCQALACSDNWFTSPPDPFAYRARVRAYRMRADRCLATLRKTARNYRGRMDRLEQGVV